MLNLLPTRSDAALRRVVRHAYENVPFYRSRFDAVGVRPEDVRTAADLARLPVVAKVELQAEPDAALARGLDPSGLFVRSSSGATGQPFESRTSLDDNARRRLARLLVDLRYGLRVGDRRAGIRTTPARGVRRKRPLARVVRAAGGFVETTIDCQLPAAEILASLRRFRPTLVDGQSGSIDRAAQIVLDAGDTSLRPRYVVTSGETLTPAMRERIREAFGAPVYDIYGAIELGVVAAECARTGLYHVERGVLVEVLRPDGSPARDGEEGRVVATSLTCFAAPLVRYATGDIAVRGPDGCPCGARVPTLRGVVGRVVHLFRVAGGREVHPWHVPVWRAQWVRQFQLAQETELGFVLRLVLAPGTSPDAVEDLRRACEEVLGPGASLAVEIVDALDVGPGGKSSNYQPLR